MKQQQPSDSDILDWKSSAEASYDAMERESHPEDRLHFYLEKLEIVASHLSEVIPFLATRRRKIEIGRRDLMVYIDVCVSRIETSFTPEEGGKPWYGLWCLFRTNLEIVRQWYGDSAIAAPMAKIVFVACVIIRQLYEYPNPQAPKGMDTGFQLCAQSVPFPLDTTLSLQQQAQRVTDNLHWISQQVSQPVSPIRATIRRTLLRVRRFFRETGHG